MHSPEVAAICSHGRQPVVADVSSNNQPRRGVGKLKRAAAEYADL